MLTEALGGAGWRVAVRAGRRRRLDGGVDRATGPGTGPGVWHCQPGLAARGRGRRSVGLHGAGDVVRGGTRTRRHARRRVLQHNGGQCEIQSI